ncbi:MAG: TIGR00282 family metallophosphoesterase [Candidatus Aminicenantes bacterium]|nr:TIGR00282 family metallophosphoesterase [Candidatus Aminicenantes bacterium]
MPDKISILFIGDVIGRPGRRVLKRCLSILRQKYGPIVVIANAENAAGGSGITEKICHELLDDVDVLTSGNHVWDKKEALLLLDKEPRLLRPANYPVSNPGKGTFVFEYGIHKIGVMNLQGRVFMEPIDCPFRVAEHELESLRKITPIIVVDFHAEATSEKQALGWHLDGKVSAVIGTHTHVPTADERILPQGTAYITDIGMVGGYNTVIGIQKEQALQRFLTSRPQRFEPGKDGAVFSAAFMEVDVLTGKALDIRRETIIDNTCGEV